MNKDWKNILIFIGIFLLITWWINSPPEEDYDSIISYEEIEDHFPGVEEPHWTHMPITYSLVFPGDCEGIPFKNLNWSFQILENSTDGLISFEEIENNADMEIWCINKDKFDRIYEEFWECKKEHKKCKLVEFSYEKTSISTYDEGILNRSNQSFVSINTISRNETKTIYEVCYTNLTDVKICYSMMGEENKKIIEHIWSNENRVIGESQIPSLFQGNLIINGTIYLYDKDDKWINCRDFPLREIHELLHSFGFDHYDPKDAIYYEYYSPKFKDTMYPYYNCNYQKELNEKYISCLKYIYSNGQIGECSSEVNFFNFEGGCGNGWYPAENSDDYCCPEPNMAINEDDYCV